MTGRARSARSVICGTSPREPAPPGGRASGHASYHVVAIWARGIPLRRDQRRGLVWWQLPPVVQAGSGACLRAAPRRALSPGVSLACSLATPWRSGASLASPWRPEHYEDQVRLHEFAELGRRSTSVRVWDVAKIGVESYVEINTKTKIFAKGFAELCRRSASLRM